MDEILSIDLSRIRKATLDRAVAVVKRGGVLLYPTDTIYGLGCSAFSDAAIRRIYTIKQRPEYNPALVLVCNHEMLRRLVDDISPVAKRFMKAFWPGPLTLIFRARKNIHPLITGERQTIAVRIPDSRFCLKLIRQSGLPIISTSANISGQPMLTEPKQVMELFGPSVDLLIDAGVLTESLPSTIVNITTTVPRIVREGAIPSKEILGIIA